MQCESGAKAQHFKVNLETQFHKKSYIPLVSHRSTETAPMSGTLLCGLALVSKVMCFFLKTVFKCRINLSDIPKIAAHTSAEVYVNHGSSWNVNTSSTDLLFKN